MALQDLLPESPWILAAVSFWRETRSVAEIQAHLTKARDLQSLAFETTPDAVVLRGVGYALRVVPITKLRATLGHINAFPQADRTRGSAMVLRVEFTIDSAYQETTYGAFSPPPSTNLPSFSLPWQVVGVVEALHAWPRAVTADVLLGRFYPDH